MDFGYSYSINIMLTHILAILGSILLWGTYVIFGIVARRYEKIFEKETGWKLLLLAPFGILVYVVIQTYAYSTHGPLNTMEQWIAYPLVTLSGVLCIYGAYKFKKVADEVMG